MNNIEVTINYPTNEFTMTDLSTSYPSVAKMTIRARVNADVKKGTLKITGKKKTNTGRGRPSMVYSRV